MRLRYHTLDVFTETRFGNFVDTPIGRPKNPEPAAHSVPSSSRRVERRTAVPYAAPVTSRRRDLDAPGLGDLHARRGGGGPVSGARLPPWGS